MKKENVPLTKAIIALRLQNAFFSLHSYKYEERGGTKVAAQYLKIGEHRIIKTLVMEDEQARPLLVLMHGDKEVSTKSLARFLGLKTVEPCRPDVAEKHTGYKVGGTSPFGVKKPMPVYMENTICGLSEIFINAGRRGLLAGMSPREVVRILKPVMVEVAI